jgi:phosphoglycolate phosphatase
LKTYAAYLFDLDGTLVDTAPDIATAFNHVMHSYGFPESSEAEIRNWVGYGARVMIVQAFEYYKLQKQIQDTRLIDEIFLRFREYYITHLAELSKPYSGVVETLEQMRQQNIPLGVVTNKITVFTGPLLDALNLDHFFQAIVSGDTLAVNKPSPEPALHACKLLSVSASETLFVGDSITDVNCARAAGCDVACFRHGYNHGTPAETLGADFVFNTFHQLLPSSGRATLN